MMLVIPILAGCSTTDIQFSDPEPTAAPTEAPVLRLEMDGDQRQYQQFVPDDPPPDEGWPLVIVVHGLGSNATEMRTLTGFDDLATEGRFIAVYPDGLARAWLDAGIGSAFSDTDIATLNLEFMDALIDEVDREYGLDERRIYMTGISNGGMFAFHVACNMSGRVAAVALVAAASISQSYDSCAPEAPVAYLALHGTSDTVVPSEGGPIVPGFDDLGEFQSAHDAARYWADVNGCAIDPVRIELPDTVSGDMSYAYRESWEPCESGRPVDLITLDGAGHTWPGHPPPGQRLGGTNLDIDATEQIWEFFQANPKPD